MEAMAAMRQLGTAVIGLGVGRTHVQAYASLEESRLVAVCDGNRERLEPVARQYQVKGYAAVEELLTDPEVEVVSICTPHPSHAALAIQVARAGRHVIVEKPMALDPADADRMIDAAQEHGVKLGGIFQRRFWAASQRVRSAIDEGKLGRVIGGELFLSKPRTEQYYARDPWRGHWATEGGGVLVNTGMHGLDLFQWYLGEAQCLWARWANLSHPGVEVEDNVAAAVQFKSGALGTIRATTSLRLSQVAVVIHGSNGATVGILEEPEGAVGYNHVWTVPGEERLATESYQQYLEQGEYMYQVGSGDGRLVWTSGFVHKHEASPSYHALQLRDFLQAILANRTPLVSGHEGRRSVELMHAIYKSGRTGQPVVFAPTA
jgi:UDP-N-acetyl-2-amino-2-deoxyglucuronate dehydrogenase